MLGTTVSLLALLGAASADVYLYALNSRELFRQYHDNLSGTLCSHIFCLMSRPSLSELPGTIRVAPTIASTRRALLGSYFVRMPLFLFLHSFVSVRLNMCAISDSICVFRVIVLLPHSTNANRLFNSQNNNRGGYNVGVRGATAAGLTDLATNLALDSTDLTRIYHTPSQPTVRGWVHFL
jgi:hypothetical protein